MAPFGSLQLHGRGLSWQLGNLFLSCLPRTAGMLVLPGGGQTSQGSGLVTSCPLHVASQWATWAFSQHGGQVPRASIPKKQGGIVPI